MESSSAICGELMTLAIHYVDRHEIEAFISLFHPDATIEHQSGTLSGHDEIRQLMERRAPERITRHILGPPVVFVDGDTARGVADYEFYEGPAGSDYPPVTLPTTVGEYHQEYRRDADGWRIASHRIVRIFHGKTS